MPESEGHQAPLGSGLVGQPLGLSLADLGWRPFYASQLSPEDEAGFYPVRVMAVHRGKIAVAGAEGEWLIPPHVPHAAPGEVYLAVGDWLLIDRSTRQIARILRRASVFKRRAPGPARRLQLIAANVDTLFVVASCNEDFNLARLERYLVLAHDVGVEPIVVLTKADLADDASGFVEAARGLRADLVVELVNAKDRSSAARLAEWCGLGRTVALVGSSGVGKSTLINTLRGSNTIATQAVREADGKGRHTTTVREMHRLDGGGWLLDTPGMRELQLLDTAEGLAEVFDDIVLSAQSCRFSNCAHQAEPDCAVQADLAEGKLDPVRLERWRKLTGEEAANNADQAARKLRVKRKRPLQGRAGVDDYD